MERAPELRKITAVGRDTTRHTSQRHTQKWTDIENNLWPTLVRSNFSTVAWEYLWMPCHKNWQQGATTHRLAGLDIYPKKRVKYKRATPKNRHRNHWKGGCLQEILVRVSVSFFGWRLLNGFPFHSHWERGGTKITSNQDTHHSPLEPIKFRVFRKRLLIFGIWKGKV